MTFDKQGKPPFRHILRQVRIGTRLHILFRLVYLRLSLRLRRSAGVVGNALSLRKLRCCLALLRLKIDRREDVQIRKNVTHDFREYTACIRAMCLVFYMRSVDNDVYQYLRVIGRCETAEGKQIVLCGTRDFLCRTGLSGNLVALNRCSSTGSLGNRAE